MLGKVFEIVGSRSRKFGYCGLVIKYRVDVVYSICQIVENVKSWVILNLLFVFLIDSVSKEDVWMLFVNFVYLDMMERYCQQFFVIFGNYVVG